MRGVTNIEELRRNIRDPLWYVPRMGIIDKHGKQNTLMNLQAGQRETLETLRDNQRVCILKPRQIGATTIVCAFLYHKALFSKDQYAVYSLTHEMKAGGRINMMMRNYWRTTPSIWRPALAKDNSQEIVFAHNGSSFRQSMAGGRSQARSFTFRAIHATEMGLWPKGSSAREGASVDEDVWASALATIHEDDESRIIIESTADGPAGIFWKMVQTARLSDRWSFLFYPWSAFVDYQADPPPNWERTDEEQKLADLHGLEDSQLAWRRMKIVDQGYGENRFRREYPLTWEDPFLLSGGMWFDTTNLTQMLASIPTRRLNDKRDLIVYEDYEPWRKYYIGGDPSGGTGRDQAVWQVLRDDLTQVAVFSSRTSSPDQFANIGAKLSAKYGKCPLLVESNNYGRAVIHKLTSLGVRLWKDTKGKDWWTDPRTKAMVYDYARSCVDNGYVELNDPFSVQELLHVREQKNGKIEADEGYSDDRADSLALALWAARRHYQGRETSERQRISRYKAKRKRSLGLT